jgi:hypothetical protein
VVVEVVDVLEEEVEQVDTEHLFQVELKQQLLFMQDQVFQ